MTHGNFKMHAEWRAFVRGLPLKCEFMHRDSFLEIHPSEVTRFPAIFVCSGAKPELCVDAEQINRCTDLSALMALVRTCCAGFPEVSGTVAGKVCGLNLD